MVPGQVLVPDQAVVADLLQDQEVVEGLPDLEAVDNLKLKFKKQE